MSAALPYPEYSFLRRKLNGWALSWLSFTAKAGMAYVAKKCGIQLQPPSIVLIYEDQCKKNLRKRIMPIRDFTKFSDCGKAAEQLKNNPRHKTYLEGVSLAQLKKLHNLLRCHLQGQTLSQSLKQIEQNETVDPEEDLNKLNDEELAQRKRIMDELFEKNRKRKEDPDFIYNVEVEFPQDNELETCEWDSETEDEF
ncbi:centrosomal protein of 19 kDa [Ahaetulla prasina]|uniref:centrosomal protein of 19 kDa n=1 Tax=Ahaetulla prasina TaxID=499056 RepID=UPI00264A021C|nr:centrosomal protein of 19 kDa [Ahaetulla prasina]